jgi:5-(carboxyamino)imidazole ribonucleotide synthase
MFAIAARRLGYRVHVFSPDDDTPTGQVADVEQQAPYDDLDMVARFAASANVVTFEFENVPAETIDAVERYAPVRPGGHVLYTTQQRCREKAFLQRYGLPLTPSQVVSSLDELKQAAVRLSPGVLKTTAWGYDGKGQARVDSVEDAEAAWSTLNTQEAILEQFVDYACEFSVVGVRGDDGTFTYFGPILNEHHHHILDVSVAPAELPPEITEAAVEIAREVLEQLGVVGVLCVEFFLRRDGQILINELAPRPHNSGHLTIDSHVTCQFEQQVRAVCGLPLGSVNQLRPAAMANLLGDCWQAGEPNWSRAISLPEVKLHLYGKSSPARGRKMGHLTALATSPRLAAANARQARRLVLEDRVPVGLEQVDCALV